MMEAIAPIDKDQNNRIAWCEKLLYALVILQFPQIASLL
jgi:hypothetical protein